MVRTRVKICCITSPEEAALAARHGADLLGLVGPMPTGVGPITLERVREVARTAPPWAEPVLLSSAETAEGLAADVEASGVRTVQVVRHVAPEVLPALRALIPGIRILQVLHVEGPATLDLVEGYARASDALLLDSGRPSVEEFGGTGRVHDWSVSAEIVRRSPVPVFLAGGLKPGNVGEAIRVVRPFGVDICSGIRPEAGRLHETLLRAFMGGVAAA